MIPTPTGRLASHATAFCLLFIGIGTERQESHQKKSQSMRLLLTISSQTMLDFALFAKSRAVVSFLSYQPTTMIMIQSIALFLFAVQGSFSGAFRLRSSEDLLGGLAADESWCYDFIVQSLVVQ
jgi:hypothetical protein